MRIVLVSSSCVIATAPPGLMPSEGAGWRQCPVCHRRSDRRPPTRRNTRAMACSKSQKNWEPAPSWSPQPGSPTDAITAKWRSKEIYPHTSYMHARLRCAHPVPTSATAIVRCGGRGNPRMSGARIPPQCARSDAPDQRHQLEPSNVHCAARRYEQTSPSPCMRYKLTNKIYLELPTVAT